MTIRDCDVQTFRSGGKGGQHQNKTESGVRVIHRASGAVGEARDSRHQHQNKAAAFRRMASTKAFRTWVMLRAAELATGETVEDLVERQMAPENLLVEVRTDNGWERLQEDDAGTAG